MDKEQFIKILKSKKSAPFLFLGSGFSKHYLNTPKWDELLQHFANKPLGAYTSMLDSTDLYVIASTIAKEVNENFWDKVQKDPNCDESRFVSLIKNQDDYLKLLISQYLMKYTSSGIPPKYKDELDYLASLNIDGVITTNWDDLAEWIFKRFKRIIGQEELLFSEVQNVGEIYAIHGSIIDSNSLVLTEQDYKDYNSKNAYLAAKLITIFVEHPIIFIGYSLSDPNIQNLLESMMNSIGKNSKGIERLRNNLIFVDWVKDDINDISIEFMNKAMSNNVVLPCIVIKAHDFMPVYELLSHYKRNIPAYLLRLYKENFYEIVRSENPENKIYALSEADLDKKDDIQFVCGFGAIEKYKSVGYKSIDRSLLYRDIIDNQGFNADLILKQTIPSMFNGKKNYLPCYKYLSEVGINTLEQCRKIYPIIANELKESSQFQVYNSLSTSDKELSLNAAIKKYENISLWKAFALIPFLDVKDTELEELRSFIKRHLNSYFNFGNNSANYFRKLICFYDWRLYGTWFKKVEQ